MVLVVGIYVEERVAGLFDEDGGNARGEVESGGLRGMGMGVDAVG